MADLHAWFSWAVVVINGLAGTWVTAAHWYAGVRFRPMWWLIHLGHATVVVQVTLGTWLVAVDDVEATQIHTFYGFLTLVAAGLVVAYRHLSQYRHLLYGLGGLFIMGLAIRAMTLDAIG